MNGVTIARFHAHLQQAVSALPASISAATAASQGLDAVLGYAVVQGLLPASTHAVDLVAAHKTRLARDLALRTPLERLSNAFANAGVSALLLKGEAWSRGIYPVAGVRSRGDCDVWVPRRERDLAIAVLSNLGFHEARPYACAGEILTPEALFHGLGLNVDLHWQLSTLSPISRGLDFDHCWRTSVPVPDLAGWRMLGPVEALLHAAMHLACPGPAGYRWIWALDGLLLLEWAATEPALLRRRAAEAGIEDLWQIYLDYTGRLTTPAGTDDPDTPLYRRGQELHMLLTRAAWRDRLRVIRELLWTREAFLRDRYPDSSAPLYWLQLRRWLQSARKIARQA